MKSEKRAKALRALAHWTSDLSPATRADDLDALRFLIAQEPVDADGDGEPDEPTAAAFARFFAEELPETARSLLRGGPVHVAPPRSPALLALARGEALVRSVLESVALGPFRDRFGLPRWFDVYRPAARLQVFEPGDSVPVLVMTAARTSRLGLLAIDLEPGTVWLRAKKLDPSAPAGLFVSVRVRDGKLTLSGAPVVAGASITLPGPLAGQLEMDLEPLTAGPAACGGPTVELPSRVVVRWSGAGAAGELVGGGVDAFGVRHDLSGAARYAFDPLLGTVVAETAVRPDAIDASAVRSPLGQLDGTARVGSGGLALPGFTPPDPAALPEAIAGGAYVMRSASKLHATLRAAGALIVDGTLWAFSAAAFFVLSAQARRPPGDDALPALRTHRIEGGPHRVALTLDTTAPGAFGLGWTDDGGTCVHSALFTARTTVSLDRPVDIVGRPLRLDATPVTVMLQERAGVTSAVLMGSSWTSMTSPQVSLAVENAVLRLSRARFLGLRGNLVGEDDLDGGETYLELEVSGWVPTQPDPYVSSVRPAFKRREGGVRVYGTLGWRDQGPPTLGFEGLLDAPAVQASPETPRPPPREPNGPNSVHVRPGWHLPSQTAAGAVPRSTKEQQARDTAVAQVQAELAKRAGRAHERNQQLAKQVRAVLDEVSPPVSGPAFLDVSTHRHQIGVQVGMHAQPREPGATGLRLSRLRVLSPLQNVRVFTVPQVQWEPVRTLDKDQKLDLGLFPTPLASRDDGGATLIGARSSRLAPVIPDLALTDMVEEHGLGRPMAVATTLPFGLAAAIALRVPGDAGAPDRVGLVRPTFPERALEGAHQLSLVAGGVTIPGGPSPSFKGRTAQLLNGVTLATGSPLGISVLGSTAQPDSSVESMFNREFTSERPRVPLTRLDLSGYGASTFSDWTNPQGAFAEATKVQFQLLVGRTALEIVKFASVIYPWGIRVTRAVTIERTGGAGVIRRDTGWQAASGGLFDFRWQEAVGSPPTSYVARPNPFTFHPGLVQGLHEVTRIRPAPGPSRTLPDGAQVAPVYFDADVYLDGLPGGGPARTEGMLGFLHLAPVGRIISNADLAAMLGSEGAVGGPVDVRVDVGGSGFAVRALRVEAAASADGSAVVCAVRGAPQLRSSGAWSAVRMPGPTNAAAPPEAVPLDDGVPLIQAGPALDPTGDRVRRDAASVGPYRFAEPVDLLQPTTPTFDVAFLQTTPTHSFAFRRPHLRPGTGRIESTLPPAVADFFARTAFRSLFPPPEAAILLGDRAYWLRLGAGGAFRLEPSVALPAPRATLVLSSGPDAGRRMFYDETTLELAIGETSWSISMPRLRMWSDLPEMSELIGMRVSLVGGSAVKAQLRDVESLCHPALETALTFMPGLGARAPVGPIELSSSNLKAQWKIHAGFFGKVPPDVPGLPPPNVQAKYYGGIDFTGIQGGLEKPEPPPEPPPDPGGGHITGGGGFDYGTFGIKVGFELRARTPPTPWFFVFGILVEVGGKFFLGDKNNALIPEKDRKDKVIMTFKVYVGVGYGAELGPFGAKVFIAAGPVFIIEGGTFKRGGFLMFEAKAGVSGIVTVKVFGEFQCVFFTKSLPAGPKDYVQFAGELGINIEIVFFTIKLSVAVVGDQAV